MADEKRAVEGVLVLKEKKKPGRKKRFVDPNAPPRKKKMSAAQREEMLIENFVGLQKAMVHLSMKFENLSDNISKLLNVFEISARDYMVNKGRTTPEVDRDLLNRVNMLLDQNKTILGNMRALEEKMKMPAMPSAMNAPAQQGMLPSQYTQSATPAKPKTIVQTI